MVARIDQKTPLGSWRSPGLSDLGDDAHPGHALIWLGTHPDNSGFATLGFATELTKPSFDEPAVGNATVSYVLTLK